MYPGLARREPCLTCGMADFLLPCCFSALVVLSSGFWRAAVARQKPDCREGKSARTLNQPRRRRVRRRVSLAPFREKRRGNWGPAFFPALAALKQCFSSDVLLLVRAPSHLQPALVRAPFHLKPEFCFGAWLCPAVCYRAGSVS